MNINKFFIIGLGHQGLVHAKLLNLRDDVEIVGGYDISENARINFQKQFSFPIYSNLNKGLEASLPDFIIIATTPVARGILFDSFPPLSALKMIILEKPLALSIQDALKIYSICKKNNWQLKIVHQSRFCDEFIALRDCIHEKRIGDLKFIKCASYGNLFNQGSHTVDLIQWMTGNKIAWVDATHNDDEKILAQASAILPYYERDLDHPGSLWSSINMRLESNLEIFMSCGWLDVNPFPERGPWLQRRLLAVGTEGYAEAHLASHYKEIRSDSKLNRSFTTSPQYFLKSLEKFYDNLINNFMNSESNQTQEGDENLYTLATLIAILSSARNHRIVSLPTNSEELIKLDDYLKVKNESRSDTNTTVSESLPLVSVIVPMETHRGLAKEAIVSWTQHQRCNPDQYEIIVVCPMDLKKYESIFQESMRPNDKLIFLDAQNEIELCHHGATHAKGQYLFFTESHCIAEPEAVEQTILFFKHNQGDGFYGRNVPICKTRVSKMELKYYLYGFNQSFKKNYWAKISLHAFGIKKQIYFDVGGFEYRYNRFAYWLLGAKLFSKGFSVNYAPGVCVAHLFAINLKMFEEFIEECARGESVYRMETNDRKFCYDFFGDSNEWMISKKHPSKEINQILGHIILKNYILINQNNKIRHLKDYTFFFKKYLTLLFGGRYPVWRYYFKWKLSKMLFRLSLNNNEKQFEKFLNYQKKFSEYTRVRYLLSNPPISKKHPQITHYTLNQIDDENFYGFYLPEVHQNQYFRWTKEISAIKLSLSRQHWEASLNLLYIRTSPLKLDLYVNHHKIKRIDIQDNTKIKFEIRKEWLSEIKNNWLFILTQPWDITADSRPLGWPVHSLEVVS